MREGMIAEIHDKFVVVMSGKEFLFIKKKKSFFPGQLVKFTVFDIVRPKKRKKQAMTYRVSAIAISAAALLFSAVTFGSGIDSLDEIFNLSNEEYTENLSIDNPISFSEKRNAKTGGEFGQIAFNTDEGHSVDNSNSNFSVIHNINTEDLTDKQNTEHKQTHTLSLSVQNTVTEKEEMNSTINQFNSDVNENSEEQITNAHEYAKPTNPLHFKKDKVEAAKETEELEVDKVVEDTPRDKETNNDMIADNDLPEKPSNGGLKDEYVGSDVDNGDKQEEHSDGDESLVTPPPINNEGNLLTDEQIQSCKIDGFYIEYESILTFEQDDNGQWFEVYKDMPIKKRCPGSNLGHEDEGSQPSLPGENNDPHLGDENSSNEDSTNNPTDNNSTPIDEQESDESMEYVPSEPGTYNPEPPVEYNPEGSDTDVFPEEPPAVYEPGESATYNPKPQPPVEYVPAPNESAVYVPNESAVYVPNESAVYVPNESAVYN